MSLLELARQVLKEVKYGKETATDIEEKVERNETQMREKPPLTRELLHDRYEVKGLSTTEIAKEMGQHPATIYYYMRKRGVRIKSRGEARRFHVQREVEYARQCIRPQIQELLKKLERDSNVERTKDGRIKLGSQPPEVRRKFKEEALRLRK